MFGSGVVNSNGVFRRPVLEAKLNEAATHHLRAIDEEPQDTNMPSTPIQVYDFSAKAAYDDVSKLIRLDSVTDDIRNIAIKEATSRQLAGQSLHDMWQNNSTFAKTISTQRTVIREVCELAPASCAVFLRFYVSLCCGSEHERGRNRAKIRKIASAAK